MRPEWSHIPLNDHPAAYSTQLWPFLVDALRGQQSVVDPMAGVGRIHAIAEAAGVACSVGVEVEPEWANQMMFHPMDQPNSWSTKDGQIVRVQYVTDCVPFLKAWEGEFSSVCFSPDYGNRMADKHEAKDACKHCAGSGYDPLSPPSTLSWCKRCKGTGLSRRNTYKHRLGRPLSERSVVKPFGPAYKLEHEEIYLWLTRCIDMRSPDPLIVLNIKNFVQTRKGKQEVVDVTDWHVEVFKYLGWRVSKWHRVHCPGNGHGQNREVRVEYESVIEFRPMAGPGFR